MMEHILPQPSFIPPSKIHADLSYYQLSRCLLKSLNAWKRVNQATKMQGPPTIKCSYAATYYIILHCSRTHLNTLHAHRPLRLCLRGRVALGQQFLSSPKEWHLFQRLRMKAFLVRIRFHLSSYCYLFWDQYETGRKFEAESWSRR